jgi:uncharacterized protein YigE (DUF2233 family)
LAILLAGLLLSPGAEGHAWVSMDQGLSMNTFPGDLQSTGITVLRIDPQRYALKLLSATETGTGPLSLRDWAKRLGLAAVINASMYQQDRMTSTGYMRNFGHVNNPSINPRFGSFMLFNPKDGTLPPLKFVDRYHMPDWQSLLLEYDTVIQNYRMISAERASVWPVSGQAFSTAGVGIDGAGNVLFIYSRFPRTVHELNTILLNLPLDIRQAMYVEGGPTAGLYINEELFRTRWLPVQSFPMQELDPIHRIPNVLGIVRK